jgi:ubiquinone biosynthesis protein UbiJ
MDAGEKVFVSGHLAKIAQNFAALCAAIQNDAARDTSVTIGDVQTALLQINEVSAALDAREENEKNGARRRSRGERAAVTGKPMTKARRSQTGPRS